MGFFSLPVTRVSNTRIYASPSQSQRDIQLVLYANCIESHAPGNCFVIPVPYPETVRFHTHPEAYQFLDRLDESFEPHLHQVNARSRYPNRDIVDYRVRHVVSLDEFEYLNRNQDILHPDVLQFLKEEYSEPFWGVIVVDIRSGAFEYNPLVYSHRKLHNSLFVPTLHHYPRRVSDSIVPEESPHWDHRLYVNGTQRSPRDWQIAPGRLPSLPWRLLPSPFREALQYLISRRYRGHHINRDFIFPVFHEAEQPYDGIPVTPPRIPRPNDDLFHPPSHFLLRD